MSDPTPATRWIHPQPTDPPGEIDTPPTPRVEQPDAPHAGLSEWKVLLRDVAHHDMLHAVESISLLTPLVCHEAVAHMFDAHRHGASHLLTTHRERAELYREQFARRGLKVTIEPA